MNKDESKQRPFLCRIGLHIPYKYMRKVGGYLGDRMACKRCGYGQSFNGWDINPVDVLNATKKQAEIEYGRILGIYPLTLFPLVSIKFTDIELKPLKTQVKSMEDMRASIEEPDRDSIL